MLHSLLILGLIYVVFTQSTVLQVRSNSGCLKYQSPLFGNEIAQIKLNISQSELAKLLNDTSPVVKAPYYKLDSFVYQGNNVAQTLKGGIKIRIRGKSAKMFSKKSFQIAFNKGKEFKNQELFGYDRISLKAEITDPTLTREKLAIEVQHAMGNCIQQSAYVRLYLNGEYWGLYLLTEAMGDDFALHRELQNNTGFLYKMNHLPLSYEGSPSYLLAFLDQGSEGPVQKSMTKYPFLYPLDNLARALNNPNFIELERLIDLNGLMRSLATEVGVRHWDNYWLKGNNYYLYFNLTTGRLSYFSYDQDLTFGTLFLPELPGPYYTNVTQMDYSDSPMTAYLSYKRPLINKILDNPKYRNIYYWYLSKVATMMQSEAFANRVFEIKNMISPFINYVNNNFTFWSLEDFEKGFKSPNYFEKKEVPNVAFYGLMPYAVSWSKSVLTQLQGKITSPIIINEMRSALIATTNNARRFSFTAEIDHDEGNAVEVTLIYASQLSSFDGPTNALVNTTETRMNLARTIGLTNIYSLEVETDRQGQPGLSYALKVVNQNSREFYPLDFPSSWLNTPRPKE